MIGVFSIAVGTPAGIGLIVGGRIADTSGRRRLIAVALPVSTIAIVGAFMVSGVSLWILSLVGGVIASAAYPALAVYRVELFPTGNRSRAAGLVTAASLIGGVLGLHRDGCPARRRLVVRCRSWRCSGSASSSSPCSWSTAYPETAHQELEAFNPEDVELSTRDRPVIVSAGDQAPVIWPTKASAASAIAPSAPLRSWPLRSIHTWVDRGRDRGRPPFEFVGRAERVVRAGDEQARHVDRRQVLDPEAVGLARRVQRIADQHQPGEAGDGAAAVDVGGDHRGHPPAHRASAHHDGAPAPAESRRGRRGSRPSASGPGREPCAPRGGRGSRVAGRRPHRRDRGFDPQQARVIAARPGTGIEQQRRLGHRSSIRSINPASSTARGGPRRGRSSPWPRRCSAPP